MSRQALQKTRTLINHWFLFQCTTALVIALICLTIRQTDLAKSLLFGSFLNILPNFLFATYWFAYYRAEAAARLVKAFFCCEIIKLIVITSAFSLMQPLLSLNLLACLIGFIGTQVAFWIAPFMIKENPNH
ncbi:MAG: ATP synthase subunit I [Gammaproteobacteria bacterium]